MAQTVKKIAQEDQPLFDALPSLVSRAHKLMSELGWQFNVRIDDDAWSDPLIEFDETGIGVTIFWGERETINGKKPVVKFGAYATTYDPGVRYYPDGSGQPPSEDLVDLGEADERPDGPLTEALKAIVEQRIMHLQEHEADEAEARYWAEAEALDE
jgi:hypothetical protein